jgi:hypothetical protein
LGDGDLDELPHLYEDVLTVSLCGKGGIAEVEWTGIMREGPRLDTREDAGVDCVVATRDGIVVVVVVVVVVGSSFTQTPRSLI